MNWADTLQLPRSLDRPTKQRGTKANYKKCSSAPKKKKRLSKEQPGKTSDAESAHKITYANDRHADEALLKAGDIQFSTYSQHMSSRSRTQSRYISADLQSQPKGSSAECETLWYQLYKRGY